MSVTNRGRKSSNLQGGSLLKLKTYDKSREYRKDPSELREKSSWVSKAQGEKHSVMQCERVFSGASPEYGERERLQAR